MDIAKLENNLVDFILKIVGPNKNSDNFRNEKFNLIKDILKEAFKDEIYIPHIFSFGSCSTKTYLQDSDIDITIAFEEKINNKFAIDTSLEFLNK
jgi:DNA polymerase sigma